MEPEQGITTLQRFVDRYVEDLAVAEAALADPNTPETGKRALAGALNYVLDLLDIFPDQYPGLGIADDAIVLRLAARQAVAAGATHERLQPLAAESVEVDALFGDLSAPLARYVERLAGRSVRGRTVDQILSEKDVRVLFLADLQRHVAAHRPQRIEPGAAGAEWSMAELRRMVRHALKKEGIV